MRLDAIRKLWDRLRAGGNREANLNSDSFTDSELALGRMVLPLLDDLQAATDAVRELKSRAVALEATLALLPVSALVLDGEGRLLTSNAKARDLFGGSGVPSAVLDLAMRAVRSGAEREISFPHPSRPETSVRVVPAEMDASFAPSASIVFLVPADQPLDVEVKTLITRFRLTRAQANVARLVVQGMTNREISKQLGAAPETIKKHLGAIYARTGVNNRASLVSLAFRAPYGPPPDSGHTPKG